MNLLNDLSADTGAATVIVQGDRKGPGGNGEARATDAVGGLSVLSKKAVIGMTLDLISERTKDEEKQSLLERAENEGRIGVLAQFKRRVGGKFAPSKVYELSPVEKSQYPIIDWRGISEMSADETTNLGRDIQGKGRGRPPEQRDKATGFIMELLQEQGELKLKNLIKTLHQHHRIAEITTNRALQRMRKDGLVKVRHVKNEGSTGRVAYYSLTPAERGRDARERP
jgi:hypothetical protein